MKRTRRSTILSCLLCALLLIATSATPALAQENDGPADDTEDSLERLLSLLVDLVFDGVLADGTVTLGEVVSVANSPTVAGLFADASANGGAAVPDGTTSTNSAGRSGDRSATAGTGSTDVGSASAADGTNGDTANENATGDGAANTQSATGRSFAVDEGTLEDAEDNRQVRAAIHDDEDIPNALLTGDEETQRELLDDPETRQAVRENDRIRRAVLTDPDLREELLQDGSENGTASDS